MCGFLKCEQDSVMYVYRPVVILSAVYNRIDDNDGNEEYPVVDVEYLERSHVTKKNKDYIEWTTRRYQVEHQMFTNTINTTVDTTSTTTSSTTQKPIIIIVTTVLTEQIRLEKLSETSIIIRLLQHDTVFCDSFANESTPNASLHTIVCSNNWNEQDGRIILNYLQIHFPNRTINGFVIDYLYLSNPLSLFVSSTIQPIVEMCLPFLFQCELMNKLTVIFVPNVNDITPFFTTYRTESTWSLNATALTQIYSITPLDDTQSTIRIPLLAIAKILYDLRHIDVHEHPSNWRSNLPDEDPFVLLKFRITIPKCKLLCPFVEPLPVISKLQRTKSVIAKEAAEKKYNEFRKSKTFKTIMESITSSDESSSDESSTDSTSGSESSDIDVESRVNRLNKVKPLTKKQLKTFELKSKEQVAASPLSRKIKIRKQVRKRLPVTSKKTVVYSPYHSYQPDDLVEVLFSDDWHPATIVEKHPINVDTGKPYASNVSRTGNYDRYRIQWYYSAEFPKQLQASVFGNKIRPAQSKDVTVEVELEVSDISEDDSNYRIIETQSNSDNDSEDEDSIPLKILVARNNIPSDYKPSTIPKQRVTRATATAIPSLPSRYSLRARANAAVEPMEQTPMEHVQLESKSKPLENTSEINMISVSTSTSNTNDSIEQPPVLYPSQTPEGQKQFRWDRQPPKMKSTKGWEYVESFYWWDTWEKSIRPPPGKPKSKTNLRITAHAHNRVVLAIQQAANQTVT